MKIQNVLTGRLEDFEALPTLSKIPVFNGCVSPCTRAQDRFVDLNFAIGRSTGVIQLVSKLDPSQVYPFQTTISTVGKTWKDHHALFCDFISEYRLRNVLEFGGAHGELAKLFMFERDYVSWHIVEPNPVIDHPAIRVTADYFDPCKHLTSDVDSVVSSHVFEHLVNPHQIVRDISIRLSKGALSFNSLPNLVAWARNKFPTALNQEHTYLLSETHFEETLAHNGFTLINKSYFKEDHSIFYAHMKTNDPSESELILSNDYYRNVVIANEYLSCFSSISRFVSNELDKYPQSKKYIFGAHLFTQYLLANGLEESRFEYVLDNSPQKHSFRLYGSSLLCMHPSVISHEENPVVVLKAGSYTNEIRMQLLALNSSCIVVE
jgi:hypothetical protein